MFPRVGHLRNCVVIIGMVLGLLFLSYQFKGIRPNGSLSFNTEVLDTCSPKNNVVFLKTHKTAGSTIQNLFMRYASKHNLLLVLPLHGNYLGHPVHFQLQMVPRLKKGIHYNILTHHSRYNYEPMKALMPDDAVFVTILRDPVALFESLYSYYTLNNTFGTGIVGFAMANDSFLAHHNQRYVKKIGRNQMSFDLGLTKDEFDNPEEVQREAERLDQHFHLVMIAEMMDQSLILLKDLLCWELDDVVAFKHNARIESKKVQLSSEVEDRLRIWNKADQLLYNYFLDRFKEKLEAFGDERMEKEIQELKQRSKEWYDYCIKDEAVNSKLKDKFKVYGKHVLGFRLKDDVNNVTCENMAKAELAFTKELQQKQSGFLAINTTLPYQVHYRRKFQRLYRRL